MRAAGPTRPPTALPYLLPRCPPPVFLLATAASTKPLYFRWWTQRMRATGPTCSPNALPYVLPRCPPPVFLPLSPDRIPPPSPPTVSIPPPPRSSAPPCPATVSAPLAPPGPDGLTTGRPSATSRSVEAFPSCPWPSVLVRPISFRLGVPLAASAYPSPPPARCPSHPRRMRQFDARPSPPRRKPVSCPSPPR